MSKVNSEQWLQAKALFDAALDLEGESRLAFLNRACRNDQVLRNEVDSLLESYERAGSFMETPAGESAAGALFEKPHKLTAGQRVKHYEILDAIGEGGMGEVYLAKDTTLGRRVALKLLPESLTSDSDRLRRFKQEARAASSLSHPNVCVIHEIGETEEGQPFIAMEYIEGVTLRRRITEEPMSVVDLLDIAIQIADAIAAAHEAGIVHRDIKPENVMIRDDGYVKVLDFGLAKLTESQKSGISASVSTFLAHSTPGLVMGTVAYMSPEQARGVAVDRRTDVWSLGVLLYEMASGRPPFEGATPTDVIVAIVEKNQAPIAQHIDKAPSELERIVRKALKKDPEERYQSIKEMAIDLRSLRKDIEIESQRESGAHEGAQVTSRIPPVTAQLIRWPNRLWLIALIVGVLAIGVWLINQFRGERIAAEPARFQRSNVTKLTTNGNAVMAAISPDGKYVAYVQSEAGKESLWLRQVAITSNVQLVGPIEGRFVGEAFSPDGNFLYYGTLATGSNSPEVYRIPLLGGGNAATRVEIKNGPIAVSHDGKRIASIRYDLANQTEILMVANQDGTGEQEVARRKRPEHLSWSWDTMPAWTADNKELTVPLVKSDAGGFYFMILQVRLADKVEQLVPLSSQRFSEPGDVELLPDGTGLLISAEAHGASFPQIWLLARDQSARSLTNDLSDYRGLSLRADGRAFVTVQRQTLSTIWSVPKGETRKAMVVTPGTSRYFDLCLAPDGKIVYASDASGNADLYEIGGDGSASRQLTSDAKRNYAPVVSPDGRHIAFHSNRSGIFQIWRMDRDGGNPRQLTFGNSESNWPVFSADGKWIIYQHFESGEPGTLWKVPTEGGTPATVTGGFAIRPAVSPDGKWIAYWQNDGQPNSRWRLAISPFEQAGPAKTFDVAPTVQVQWDTALRWSPDSRSLTYVDHRGGIDNLWGQLIDGGAAKQLTDFKDSGRIFSFDWSRGGDLVASRGVIPSDVVLISEVDQ